MRGPVIVAFSSLFPQPLDSLPDVGVVADRELLIRSLVRLRRAEHAQPGSRELPEVRAELETLVGPSVPRALAARVLGVSRTALDRRIDRGDVPVLITP